MKYILSTTLVIVIVLGLSILGGNINAEPIINSTIKISKSESPIGVLPPVEYNGTNFLTYVKSGGFVPVNQIYTYNVFNKEISSVDVNNNTIAKKNLNETQLKSLNDVVLKQFSSADENGILDYGSCADCTKHDLDYVYVILNATTGRQIYLTNGALWTDSTPQENVAGFLNITATLEKLMN